MSVHNKEIEQIIERELRDRLSDYQVEAEIISVNAKQDPTNPGTTKVKVKIEDRYIQVALGDSSLNGNMIESASKIAANKIAGSYLSDIEQRMPVQSKLSLPFINVRDYETDITISCPFCSEELHLSEYRSTYQNSGIGGWDETSAAAMPYNQSSTTPISELNDRERIIARLYMLGKLEEHLRFNCSGESASALETFL